MSDDNYHGRNVIKNARLHKSTQTASTGLNVELAAGDRMEDGWWYIE